MNAASHFGAARRSDGSQSETERDRHDADQEADRGIPERARVIDGLGVSTAAGICSTVSIPVELVTPTEIGSSSTQSYGTTIVLERRRPSVAGPVQVNGTMASSTVTDATVRSSRCGFVTLMRISPGLNSTRRTSNLIRRRRVAAEQIGDRVAATPRTPTTTTMRSSSGPSAQSRQRAPPGRVSAPRLHQSIDVEEAHPAELGELRLVRVEHEVPGVGELDLDHSTLPLALHDGVGVLPVLAGAGRLIAEEVAVEVEAVDQVELGQVGEVDADELANA